MIVMFGNMHSAPHQLFETEASSMITAVLFNSVPVSAIVGIITVSKEVFISTLSPQRYMRGSMSVIAAPAMTLLQSMVEPLPSATTHWM